MLGALSDHPIGLGAALAAAAWLLVLLLVGELPRRRAEQFAAARRARAAEREAAAGEERLALARDLHDTIGHSLSLIAVQAGVALHLLDEHPEQARPALTAIRDASRDALDEVRTVLAVLRAEGDVPRTPAPALDDVTALVAQARAGGLQVDLAPEALADLAIGVPGPVQAAAYRVVQESLTNITRHAAGDVRDRAAASRTGRAGGRGVRRRDGPRAGVGGTWAAGHAGARPGAGWHRRRRRASERRPAGRRPLPAGSGAGARMIDVVVADDQALVRAGFRALLDAEPGPARRR